MAWCVHDPRVAQDLVLVLPRAQPLDAALEHWEASVRRASRLQHPNLARTLEIGSAERWPYVLYDPAGAVALHEHLQGKGLAATEAAALIVEALQGLAFAHDGGVAHRDLQPYLVLVGEGGRVRLLGLEVAWAAGDAMAPGPRDGVDAPALRAQREAARADVTAMGVLLQQVLTGQPALDEPDVGLVVERMPPQGRDLVRLPWDTTLPIPEPMRAIANRCTDRQERQRYGTGRSLQRALEGWLQAESDAGGGPLALLIDRLHSVGALPASPGSGERAARLAMMERERTNELAEVVLQDLALAFELLRAVNTAQVRGAQVAGSGPVLTVRRAIAMLGLDGVRRAALGLRAWPGPLAEPGARELKALMDSVKRAGRVAQALRPAGYDAEVVYLVTLLQNLGRLIGQYHLGDELQQIRRLMQPAMQAGEATEAGMSEQAASYAVLGTDIEAIGAAVARHWGLDDSVLYLIRRLPLGTPPRTPESDDDVLRAVASCANEAVDAAALPAPQAALALARVVQRYARSLHIERDDLLDALKMPKPQPTAADESADSELDRAA